MASFYLDAHGNPPVRVRCNMNQHTALSTFKNWVGCTALQNGLSILTMTDTEATLGLPVAGSDKPAVAAYLSIEPYSPPSKPEYGQPCRRALKGA